MSDMPRCYPCPSCHGDGYVGQRRCAECQGVAFIARQGEWLLAWRLPIDAAHLRQRQVFRIAELSLVSLALGISALGAISLSWQVILLSGQGGGTGWIWEQVSFWMLTFWLSLLVDSYLIYHVSLTRAKIHHLPRRADAAPPSGPPPSGWDDARRAPKARQQNLADYYAPDAIAALERAWHIAARWKHRVVAPLHVFLALLEFPAVAALLVRLGVTFQHLRRPIGAWLPRYATSVDRPLVLTAEVYPLLFAAYGLATAERQKKVDLPDLFSAVVGGAPEVRDLLLAQGVDQDKITNVSQWLRFQQRERARLRLLRRKAAYRPRHGTIDRAMTGVATPWLQAFGQDLTLLARGGLLEPCVNRQRELEQLLVILSGEMRHHAVLVGNPGVGKRTLVNGVAHLMVADDVPPWLRDKRLVSLSVPRIVSGVSASVAEERMLRCVTEAARSGNVLLFVHDIDAMVGITAGGGGSLDLAGALAQAVTASGVRLIATAAPTAYARNLENHALGQILERVEIAEPAGNAALQIVQAKAGQMEARERVWFTYDAVAAAVNLSQRYLHDRALPDKAVELLEVTALRVANEKGRGSTVSGADVAAEISRKTNIPLTEVTVIEREKLLALESEIHRRVVDQTEAVRAVSAAIRRARAELRDQRRPIVSLLFLGPTGVGKTELAKTVAAVYFGSVSPMIRLDMSEYQEKTSVNRILGAPPGFEGSGVGGYLTEAVRRHPFSLVLLDEMEKAHPDILNLFLQVMDDGRLTDAVGRTIDFTNVMVIATSNACTSEIQHLAEAGKSVAQIKTAIMTGALQQFFRPELLNRFDGIIVFKPLALDEVRQITRLMLRQVAGHLAEKGIALAPSAAAVNELAAAGFDPAFGVRPLRRVIQERVEDAIVVKMLRGEVERRDTVVLEADGIIRVKKPSPP